MPGPLCDYWKSMARGKDFRVQAIAREKRELAMERAEEAVRRERGDILDFKMFSNLSLNLVVEMSGGGVLALVDWLGAAGWNVELDPGREALLARAADRLEGTFQVTFPEGDGELVIRLPAVPG